MKKHEPQVDDEEDTGDEEHEAWPRDAIDGHVEEDEGSDVEGAGDEHRVLDDELAKGEGAGGQKG